MKMSWREETLKGSKTVGNKIVAWLPRRRREREKARQRREIDARGQTGSENIKAKRKLPDRQTGVYLNECSFRPVVCRNHCYPLTAGCPVVSFHLLLVSSFHPPFPFSTLLVSFCLIFSSSGCPVIVFPFWTFQDDIGAAYSLAPSLSELHIWPDSHSNTHPQTNEHAHVIQMRMNIAHQEPEGTNKMNDKWHKWLEETGLPWISKTLSRGHSAPSSFNHAVISPVDVYIQFPNPCVTDVWLKACCLTGHVSLCSNACIYASHIDDNQPCELVWVRRRLKSFIREIYQHLVISIYYIY